METEDHLSETMAMQTVQVYISLPCIATNRIPLSLLYQPFLLVCSYEQMLLN
jgi:hypothetical protein